MLGELPRFPFVSDQLASAPEDRGIYVLWEGTEITKVGLADSPEGIKGELVAHFTKRRTCPCTPTHYSWFLSRDPLETATELLREHSRYFTDLPRCNRS